MRLITLSAITGAEDMFDGFLETQTETADAIMKTFDVAGKNCVAILNNYGITATLEVGGETLTVSLIRDSIKDWRDYFFAPSRIGRDTVFYFPTQVSGNATLTIAYTGGTAKCGLCVTGLAREIGTTEYGVTVGIADYSKVTTDGFGQTYLAAGKWAKRAQSPIYLPAADLDIAYREIIKNRGAACIFDYNNYPDDPLETNHTSADGLQCLVVYGYTEDFTPGLPEYGIVRATHESQGLT